MGMFSSDEQDWESICTIHHLKAEIEKLNEIRAELSKEIEMLKNDRDFWESAATFEVNEAIIEFAERILKDSRKYFVSTPFVEHVTAIATEMIEKER